MARAAQPPPKRSVAPTRRQCIFAVHRHSAVSTRRPLCLGPTSSREQGCGPTKILWDWQHTNSIQAMLLLVPRSSYSVAHKVGRGGDAWVHSCTSYVVRRHDCCCCGSGRQSGLTTGRENAHFRRHVPHLLARDRRRRRRSRQAGRRAGRRARLLHRSRRAIGPVIHAVPLAATAARQLLELLLQRRVVL